MKLWFTPAEIAAANLPGLPDKPSAIVMHATRNDWRTASDAKGQPLARKRQGRGGGWEYHISLLPEAARPRLVAVTIRAAASSSDRLDVPFQPVDLSHNGEADPARAAILMEANTYASRMGLPRLAADQEFSVLFNRGEYLMADWVHQAIKKISPRTLARWRANGAKAPAYPKTARSILLTDSDLKATIGAIITSQPHATADHIHAYLSMNFPDRSIPSLRSVQRAIASWKEANAALLVKMTDPDRFKSTLRPVGTALQPSALNELWQVDASPADMLCTDGRYNLYVLIDVYSRRLMVSISKTAKADAVLLLLRRAILSWGVPQIFRTDNGSDFKAQRVQKALAALGIIHDACPPSTPEYKGNIERAIGTIQHDLMPLVPGYIGHNVADRKRIEAQKAFAQRLGETPENIFKVEVTSEELQHFCDQWAEQRYAHKPHAGLDGQTPFARTANWQGTLRRIENERALDLLLAPIPDNDGLRRVGKQGIRIDHAYFVSPILLPGEQVLCRHDPSDLGKIYCFDVTGETFLAEAICPERLGIDRQEIIRKMRAEQSRRMAEDQAEIRRIKRGMNNRSLLNAVLQKAAVNANLISFPKPAETHSTPSLAAAGEAAGASHSMGSLAAEDMRVASAPGALTFETVGKADGAAHARSGQSEIIKLSPLQLFQRARELEQRLGAGAAINEADRAWLQSYQGCADYRAYSAMYEDFGEELFGAVSA